MKRNLKSRTDHKFSQAKNRFSGDREKAGFRQKPHKERTDPQALDGERANEDRKFKSRTDHQFSSEKKSFSHSGKKSFRPKWDHDSSNGYRKDVPASADHPPVEKSNDSVERPKKRFQPKPLSNWTEKTPDRFSTPSDRKPFDKNRRFEEPAGKYFQQSPRSDRGDRIKKEPNAEKPKRDEKRYSGEHPGQRYERKPLVKKSSGFRKDIPPLPAEPANDKGTQLNKYLSNAGIAARRKCEEFIEEGLVTVNNKVVKQSGYRVQKTDTVKYKGEKVGTARKQYVLLNKQKNFITTTSDDRGRRTVMDLVQDISTDRLYPVGRLDRNTTGLLLLTNDGELAQKLTHPSKKVKKVYEVTLDRKISEQDMEHIAKGIELEDGIAEVDEIAFTNPADKRIIGIELHSGKNRIVRRIFEKLAYEVVKLDRVLYAGLTKKNLPRGHWRMLTEEEILSLKHFL